MKTVNPEVLGGAAAKKTPVVTKLKNITPAGERIKNVTNKIKGAGAAAGATAGVAAVTTKNKVEPPKTKTFQNRISGNGKNEVNPEKNPVVKKTAKGAAGRGATVDRVYGAQIAQTRKLKGDAAANKQRQKFINRPITSREMDESVKDELLSKAAKAHKKAKNFKKWRNEAEKARQTALKPGEVRWMDKKTGKWKSNKEEVEHIDEKKKGLWDNIHAKRKRGEPPAKKGDKDYPKTLNVEAKTAAWQRKEGKNKKGGLNEKGRKSYERENPGSDLKAPQPGGGPRKRSFCARMGGVKGPMKKPDGSPTRKALALRKWKC